MLLARRSCGPSTIIPIRFAKFRILDGSVRKSPDRVPLAVAHNVGTFPFRRFAGRRFISAECCSVREPITDFDVIELYKALRP